MDRRRAAGKVAAFVVVQVLVITGLLWVLNQLQAGTDDRARQAVEIAALEAGLDEANARLAEQGEPTVPVPEVEKRGDTPAVPVAPTQAQILSAFAVWCDLESCHGDDGEDGEDAPPMTQQQIFAGFNEWCSTDPRCVGKPGADSTTPGPPGRGPTPEEVLAAVQVVCADGACVGAAGKDGSNGAPGKDAPRIVGVKCVANDLIFEMSEGPAFTAANACVSPSPTPTPTPTASTTKGR